MSSPEFDVEGLQQLKDSAAYQHVLQQFEAVARQSPMMGVWLDPTLDSPLLGALQAAILPDHVVEFKKIHDELPHCLRMLNGRSQQIQDQQWLQDSLLYARYETELALAADADPRYGRSICLWLPRPQAWDSASIRPLQKMAQLLDHTGQPRYLRYWDPRVLMILESILTPEQYGRLYQLLHPCFYLDWDGQLCQLTAPSASQQHFPLCQTPYQMSLNHAQWQQLEQVLWVNRAIRMVAQWSHELIDESNLDKRKLIPRLYQCFQRAAKYGFLGENDAYVFVTLALTVHWHFDQHPIVQPYLTHPTAVSLADTLLPISEQQWQSIAQTDKAQKQMSAN
ncbi:MAG: hypothetical protein VXW65_00575 [Pseudomonadota bacterium]|nr:hypothetical protein [Pseudomonadota bacterium]